VPLLIGANSDEGVSFSTKGLDNATAIFNNLLYWRSYSLSPPTIRKLLELYPNDPSTEPPYRDQTNTTYPKYGLQWRRDAAIGGDLVMISGRRKTCEEYVKGGVSDVYSYRFDTPLWNASAPVSVPHFVNVVFSFQNISGALGPLPEYQSYKDLSLSIGKAYASFVNHHQPNGAARGGNYGAVNVTGLPLWPKYSLNEPKNMVLNANGSFVEDDTFRKEGIAFINTIDRELLA
jgi:carboxylesterase type B